MTTTTCHLARIDSRLTHDDSRHAVTLPHGTTVHVVCGLCLPSMVRFGFVLTITADEDREPIGWLAEDDAPFVPPAACVGCGTVDAATESQDDEYGPIFPYTCAACANLI